MIKCDLEIVNKKRLRKLGGKDIQPIETKSKEVYREEVSRLLRKSNIEELMGNPNEDSIDDIINTLSNTIYEATRWANSRLDPRTEDEKGRSNIPPIKIRMKLIN